MPASETPELDRLVGFLRDSRVDARVDAGPAAITVAPRATDGPAAIVEITEELYRQYLDKLSTSYAGREDPLGNARGLAMVHVLDYLTTTHTGGVNQVRRLSLVRDDQGLHFVEERADDPGPPPDQPDAFGRPHDHPDVFAQEFEALATGLRAQGIDAVADAAGSTIEVGTRGRGDGARPVTIELRPDLYRQYLDGQEADFEAIGGDPRARAWAAWWWTLAHALQYGIGLTPLADLWRLSFLRSADGQVVGLFANTTGTEPSGPTYVWSTEPPSGRHR